VQAAELSAAAFTPLFRPRTIGESDTHVKAPSGPILMLSS